MSKVTLDKETFKALASEARLTILKSLDGRPMNLSEIAQKTKLNKATVHEHLTKLYEAKLVKKKEREGHKWVYYKLAWKGASLIHPENTKIVILLSMTFIFLGATALQFWWYAKGKFIEIGTITNGGEDAPIFRGSDNALSNMTGQNLAAVTKAVRDAYGSENINIVPQTIENNATNATANSYQVLSFINEPIFLYAAIICFIAFLIILSFSIWKIVENTEPKL